MTENVLKIKSDWTIGKARAFKLKITEIPMTSTFSAVHSIVVVYDRDCLPPDD